MNLKNRLNKLEKLTFSNHASKVMQEYQSPMFIEALTSEEVETQKNEILRARAGKLNLDYKTVKYNGAVIVDNIPEVKA